LNDKTEKENTPSPGNRKIHKGKNISIETSIEKSIGVPRILQRRGFTWWGQDFGGRKMGIRIGTFLVGGQGSKLRMIGHPRAPVRFGV